MLTADKVFNFLHDNRWLPVRSMTVFNYLLEATLCGAILIVIVLLARRFLRGKLGNRAVYFAWLLVALRLLVPLSLPNPAMNELRPTYSTDVGARPVADQIRVRVNDALGDIASVMEPDYHARRGTDSYGLASFINDLGVYGSYGWTGKWYLLAYLTADGLVLGYVIFQNVRFRRRLRRGRVSALDGTEKQAYLALCDKRHVKPLPVYYVDPLPSACLVGVLRPYIALPLSLKPDERMQALTHELCHHKAHDEWWGVLRNLCCIVHWFNPLVWIAARCARTDCEMACDDRVTAQMDDAERAAYANTLVLAAKREAPRMSVLATGMTMTGKRLKQRVSAIVHNVKVQRWAVITFVALTMCLTVAAFGTAELREESYDIKLDKAKYGYQLDEPFEATPPQMEPILAMDIQTEAQALDYARQIARSPFFDRDASTLSAMRVGDMWRVSAPGVDEGWEVYFTAQSKLVYYNSRIYKGYAEYPFSSTDSVRAAVNDHMRAFAKAIDGDPDIGQITLDADYYELDGRYAFGQAISGGGEILFQYRLELTEMRLVYYADTQVTFPVGSPALALAMNSLRGDLTETSMYSGLTAQQVERGTFEAEAADANAFTLRFTIAAADIDEPQLSAMQDMYGAIDSYVFEQTFNAYGSRLEDGMPAETTPDPSAEPQPLPTPQIISLVEKDGVTLRFNAFDSTDFSISYSEPTDGDLPVGEAIELAVQAICDKYGFTRDIFIGYTVNYAFTTDPGMADVPYWWLTFLNSASNTAYSVSVHSPDGAVLDVFGPEDSNG